MSIFIFQKKEKRNIESNFNFQKESLIFSPTIINQRSRKRGINTEHIYTFKAIVGTIIISLNEMSVIRPELHHFLFGQAWFYSTASVKWPGHTYRARFYTPPLTKHNAIFLPRLPPQFYSTCQTGRGSCTLVRPNNSFFAGRTASSNHLFHVLIKVLLPTHLSSLLLIPGEIWI